MEDLAAVRTGLKTRAIKGKPAKAGSEPALAGLTSIARGFIPVRGGAIGNWLIGLIEATSESAGYEPPSAFG